MKENSRKDRLFRTCILFIIGFIVIIVPIINAGFYAHPVADDYTYSVLVHEALKNGGGLGDVIKAALIGTAGTYKTWQGTFAAVFLFALQPGVFSQQSYWLTTAIMIGALSFSTLFLIDTIVVKILRQRKETGILIGTILLINMIELVPDKAEAFFWYNGSSYYTLFYSFALVWVSLLIRLYNDDERKWLAVVAGLLSLVIGGGNYTTALVCLEIITLVTSASIIKKKRNKTILAVLLLLLFSSLTISAVAPGNAMRAGMVTGTAPTKAVLESIVQALVFIGTWTRLAQLAGFAICFVLVYPLAENCDYGFKKPITLVCIAFLLFASQLTPPIYAMSSYGAGRQIDIYYYSYYLLILFVEFHVAGWISHNKPDTGDQGKKHIDYKRTNIIIILLIIIWSAGFFQYGLGKLTSVDTAIAYREGYLQRYDSQYYDMIETIGSADLEDIVEVKTIDTVPDFFLQLNLDRDHNHWINQSMARYFGVKGIALKQQVE